MSIYSVLDFYNALEIPRSASITEIQKAYRRLALRSHPDKAEGEDSSVIFQNISHAYEVLSNPKVRAAYDKDEILFSRKLGESQTVYTQEQALDLFQRFFGTNNPFGVVDDGVHIVFEKDAPPPPPPDVRVDLWCTLEELFSGCKKNMSVPVRVLTSNGDIQNISRKISVTVESGWDDGTELRFPKEHNDITGDIVFLLKQRPHDALRRDGDNLFASSDVSLLNSLIGHTVTITGADQRVLHVRVDEIIHAKFKKVVKGEGMRKISADGTPLQERGDLIIDFYIVFPTKLEDMQKELLKMALRFPKDMPEDQHRALTNALAGKIEKPKEEEE